MTHFAASPTPCTEDRLRSIHALVGETPAVEIRCRAKGAELTIVAKLESRNLTGSIKDRMALHVLELAYEHGALQPGQTIVEATSGNTGIAFAAIGRALGHPVRIYMPDWMSRERTLLIRGLGAGVVPVSADEGGFVGCIDKAAAWGEEHGDCFLPKQFESPANAAAHEHSTGPELLAQCRESGHALSAFVAGVGTGGTVMGVGRYLRRALGDIPIHPLEPANSPTLRTGEKAGHHRIQGISDEFIPPIIDFAELDEIVDVWDGDAIRMAQRLSAELGLGVGISSGANFLGAVQVALHTEPAGAVATVFPDCNKKYLSTDLCGDEPARAEYLAPTLELGGYRALPPPSVAV